MAGAMPKTSPQKPTIPRIIPAFAKMDVQKRLQAAGLPAYRVNALPLLVNQRHLVLVLITIPKPSLSHPAAGQPASQKSQMPRRPILEAHLNWFQFSGGTPPHSAVTSGGIIRQPKPRCRVPRRQPA